MYMIIYALFKKAFVDSPYRPFKIFKGIFARES